MIFICLLHNDAAIPADYNKKLKATCFPAGEEDYVCNFILENLSASPIVPESFTILFEKVDEKLVRPMINCSEYSCYLRLERLNSESQQALTYLVFKGPNKFNPAARKDEVWYTDLNGELIAEKD